MSTMRYQDFDLAIELLATTPPRYRTRVLASPAGQAGCEFDLPFAPLELENLILRIGRPRRGIRRLDSPEMRAAQEFGSKLFAQAFQGQVQANFWRSLDLARQQGDGLRIRLRLTDAPDLADVPWEYLYDTAFHRFLAHSTYTPLVRYLDLPQTTPPLRVQPPLQILVMIASPRDQAALDVEAEWSKVQGALAELEQRGLVQVTRLEQATLAALQRQLRRQPYHVFHFIGHGGFDQQSQSGVLLLEDERGLSRLISGHHLGTLLHNHAALRLALLNACEGARTAMNDPFAGVAQQLVQQGLPAVIAMQFEITDPAAITLAQEFYAALADGYPVDAALTEARVALFTQGNDIEWGTPVLYLRAQDGLLFAVDERYRPIQVLEQTKKKRGNEVQQTGSSLPASQEHGVTTTTRPTPIKPGQPVEGSGSFVVLDAKGHRLSEKISTIQSDEQSAPVSSDLSQSEQQTAVEAKQPVLVKPALSDKGNSTAQNEQKQTLTDQIDETTASEPVAEEAVAQKINADTATAQEKIRVTEEAKSILSAKTSAPAKQQSTVRKRDWWLLFVGLVGVVIALYLGALGLNTYQTNQRHAQATATQEAVATVTQEAVATVTQEAALVTATAIASQLQATATAIAPQLQATATAMLSKEAPALQPLADKYGIKLVPVPGGTFQMGSPDGIGESDEHPQHAVMITNFWIGQTEVTNRQYGFFVDAHGYSQDNLWTAAGLQWRNANKVTAPNCWQDEKWNQPDYPVVCLSWYEAVAYIRWLAHETNLPVRLPTEAEWEWAARGADGRIYPWGDADPTDQLLNYAGSNLNRTSTVGSYPGGASPYRALDMAGNVWEWTSTAWGGCDIKPGFAYPYDGGDGRENPEDICRVIRGGAWNVESPYVRSADRSRQPLVPVDTYDVLGLRLVVSAPQ